MAWVSLNCPQCSAPLPRMALWRSVKCASCGALITRTEAVVTRDSFRQALARARQSAVDTGRSIQCGGWRYQLRQTLGGGEDSEVYLARRVGALPILATIKLSSAPDAAKRLAQEARVARELQALDGGGAGAFFSLRLPEVVAQGVVEGSAGQQALVLRHPNGYWGDLAALNEHFPQGLDPRHAVWMWRRMLDVLGFVHSQGWCHGDVRPEHALVHVQDHGVRLIGWGSAHKAASAKDWADDLRRSARVVLVLLNGASDADKVSSQVPTGLAELVMRASQDVDFCHTQGAQGLDALLRASAKAAFGPPTFVPLTI